MSANGYSLVIEPAKCVGCRTCEVACSVYQEGVSSLALSRVKVVRREETDFFFPVVCQQCETPYCALPCPTNALRKNLDTGLVEFAKERCVGCKMCILSCPFGAITLGADGRALKCNLCEGDPACVKFCWPQALTYRPAAEMGATRRAVLAETFEKSHRMEE